MGLLKKLTTGSVKLAKAADKGIKDFGDWQDRQQAKDLTRKRKQLTRLKVEANIAKQKAKLKKYKPKDPFDDWNI